MKKRVALVTGGMGGIGTADFPRAARTQQHREVGEILPGVKDRAERLALMRRCTSGDD